MSATRLCSYLSLAAFAIAAGIAFNILPSVPGAAQASWWGILVLGFFFHELGEIV